LRVTRTGLRDAIGIPTNHPRDAAGVIAVQLPDGLLWRPEFMSGTSVWAVYSYRGKCAEFSTVFN
jgi:hypothetical protein